MLIVRQPAKVWFKKKKKGIFVVRASTAVEHFLMTGSIIKRILSY